VGSARQVPFDAWGFAPTAFSFPALEGAIEAAGLPAGARVIDPFVGSNRSGTMLAGRGNSVTGIEAHPLMAELAELKFARPGSGESLVVAAEELLTRVDRLGPGSSRGPVSPVLERFVSPAHLKRLIDLREGLEEHGGPWQRHLRWLVLQALRKVVGGGWPYPRPRKSKLPPEAVDQTVRTGARQMSHDLALAPRLPRGRIIKGDARDPKSWAMIPASSLGGTISSPPYLNQVCYWEVLRLEVLFLNLASNWSEMRKLVDGALITSCTQQVTKTSYAEASQQIAKWPVTAEAIEMLSLKLEFERLKRPRGKVYDLLMPSYFADLGQVFENLIPRLAPGGRLSWVIGDSAPYGVYVDTPQLIAGLAQECGLEVIEDRELRPRGGRWSQSSSKKLSERLLVCQRPVSQLQMPVSEPQPSLGAAF
jgi:hypothetical protein